jgi:hypothetical protein
LSIAEGKLTLHVRGVDKLRAFKSTLEIPLLHIAPASTSKDRTRLVARYETPRNECARSDHGLELSMDINHPEKTIVIDRHDERYKQSIVEVAILRQRLCNPECIVKLPRYRSPTLTSSFAQGLQKALAADYWEQGLATEGAHAIVRYGFETLGLELG